MKQRRQRSKNTTPTGNPARKRKQARRLPLQTEQDHTDDLHRAIFYGDCEAVRRLVPRGEALDQPLSQYFAPLVEAAYYRQLPIVELLLELGANPNVGRFPPLLAVTERPVIGHPYEDLGDGDPGPTAEELLATEVEIVRRLLDAGADLHVGDRGWTPICAAARRGNLEVVRLLLDRGADPNVNVPQFLLSKNYGSPTFQAFNHRHCEVLDLLLASGAAAFKDDWLWHAAREGDLEMVRIFLKHGARPDYQDEDGRSVLAIAEERGHLQVADLIREHLGVR